MPACPSCGAPARPGEEACRFCGGPVRPELSGEETETLVRVFLEAQEKALRGVNGPRIWAAGVALVVLPVGAFLGVRALGHGWPAAAALAVFTVLACFLFLGVAVQAEQDLFFERTLRGRIRGFLEENRLDAAKLLVLASRVMKPDAELMKRLANL
ncbi:zinc ribbon domain-containing protein [Acidobacteria bacterium ACD]|nr:MAG: zinc ribbon domain-containing protein [Acidobacteriota bacterium]MDL1950289.1 zinc ribbon domain-containing protein [Acidobacteria bacterium ACD]